jgi:hypothetical protein
VWFLKANPSYLSMLFDMNKKDLESVIYCSKTMTLELSLKGNNNLKLESSPQSLFNFWKKLVSPANKKIPAGQLGFSVLRFSKLSDSHCLLWQGRVLQKQS